MKSKIVIAGIALAAVMGATVALWPHRQEQNAAPTTMTVTVNRTEALPSKFHTLNSIEMATMVRPGGRVVRPKQAVAFNPRLNVWPDIRLITDTRADYWERLAAVGRLPAQLSEADWGELREFLLKPDALDSDQLGQVLKNKIMDVLCGMNPMPAGLEAVLAQIYGNHKQDEVIRDYAVQHLVTFDEQPQNVNAKARQSAQEVLWSALDETGDSIAGTALLGLTRLSRQYPNQVNQNKLEAAALQLANSDMSGELTLITAYQVCGQLNVQDALPAIEAAAKSSQTVSLRISAIGTLGFIGGVNDIPLLQDVLRAGNERLQLPAQAAIQRIEQRTGGKSS